MSALSDLLDISSPSFNSDLQKARSHGLQFIKVIIVFFLKSMGVFSVGPNHDGYERIQLSGFEFSFSKICCCYY